MALSATRLYYRHSGITYSCNLYTSPGDDGMTDSMKLYRNGYLYAPLSYVGDGRQSAIRVQKAGATKSILRYIINYIATWTQFGFVDNPTVTSRSPNKTVSATYSVYVDYNQINSTAAPFNLMIQFNVQYNDAGVPMYYKIDGVQYNVGYTSASGTFYHHHRLSTGTHTVILYGVGHYFEGVTYFETYGFRTAPV